MAARNRRSESLSMAPRDRLARMREDIARLREAKLVLLGGETRDMVERRRDATIAGLKVKLNAIYREVRGVA